MAVGDNLRAAPPAATGTMRKNYMTGRKMADKLQWFVELKRWGPRRAGDCRLL